jgi:hypothetical protein
MKFKYKVRTAISWRPALLEGQRKGTMRRRRTPISCQDGSGLTYFSLIFLATAVGGTGVCGRVGPETAVCAVDEELRNVPYLEGFVASITLRPASVVAGPGARSEEVEVGSTSVTSTAEYVTMGETRAPKSGMRTRTRKTGKTK